MIRNLVDCSYRYLYQQLMPAVVDTFVYVVPAGVFAMASAAKYGYVGHSAMLRSCFYLRWSTVGNDYVRG